MRRLDYPPIWLLGALALVWGETLLVPDVLPWAWAQALGTGAVVVAVLLVLAAGWEFLRARSTIIPHQTPQKLITTGVFAYTRNPIYLADLLILAGFSLRWGAVSGLLLLPVLAFVLHHRFILGEESRIRAAFGPDATAYFARTRRWI